MKHLTCKIAVAVLLVAASLSGTAQVGVNTLTPDSTALLDIRYMKGETAVGVLLPDLRKSERDAKIGVVSDGMLVFDRYEKLLYYYDGNINQWVALNPLGSKSTLNGLQDIRPQNDSVNKFLNMSLGLDTNEVAQAKFDVKGNVQVRGSIAAQKNIVAQDTIKSAVLEVTEGLGVMPIGGIIMWSGTTVPRGWAICDGTTVNSCQTPDLRGRFIVGYGANANGMSDPTIWDSRYAAVGSTAGEMTHVLTSTEMPSHSHDKGTLTTNNAGEHSHTYNGYIGVDGNDDDRKSKGRNRDSNDSDYGGEPAGNHFHTISGSTGNTGGSAAHENRPPYYVLAFIMRVQ